MNRIDVSGRISGLADADYLVGQGDVEPNHEAQQFCELRSWLRPIEERLDIAWCGAVIAQIFRHHPWLQSFQLELWTESVYNDDGGSFMAHYARFRDVVACAGVELPDDLQDAVGALDSDAAASLLDSEHEDDEFDLCTPFIEQGNADSCTLTLDRGALAPLLAVSTVSGLAVARLLWPNHESLRPWAQPAQASAGIISTAEATA